MVFTKKVLFSFRLLCRIHNAELVVRYFEGPTPIAKEGEPLVYRLDTGICRVDDGCGPENYIIELVGEPKLSDDN